MRDDLTARSFSRLRLSKLPATLLALLLAAAPDAGAADCNLGPDSPRPSSAYLFRTEITGCDGSAGYGVALKARIVMTRRGPFGTVLSRIERVIDLDEATTDASGVASIAFDWCEDIAPQLPLLPGIVTTEARAFVSVSAPDGPELWVSAASPLENSNLLTVSRDLSNHAYCSAEPPLVQIDSPIDGTVFQGVDCPFDSCLTPVGFSVSLDSAARVLEVGYEVYDAAGVHVDTGALCRYDPIESSECATPVENRVGLREGTWTVVVIAEDDFGLVGTDEVELTILPGDAEYPGPIQVATVSPMQGAPRVQLTGGAIHRYADGSLIGVFGENFHSDLQVFLSPATSLVSSADWILYECVNVRNSADGTLLSFQVPEIPETTPMNGHAGAPVIDSQRALWRILIRDNYLRPGVVLETAIPGFVHEYPNEAYFNLVDSEYPMVHGLGFVNEEPRGSLNQFLSVYGDNAYVLGLFPDPIYMGIWYPVFEIWMAAATGSCVGMAATSRLMADGDLDPRDIDPDVYRAAGFVNRGDEAWTPGPGSNFFGPPSPSSVWSHVLRNHGVQTSAEFWKEWAQDLSLVSWGGDPRARLAELRRPGARELVCAMSGFDGHCVTPYGTVQTATNLWDVAIYDNNNPRSPRSILIDTDENTYDMSYDFDKYEGDALTTIPMSLWKNSRSMPGITDITEVIVLVIGDAEPEIESNGGSWRVSGDGEVISDIPGAVWAPPLNGERSADGAIPLLLPASTRSTNVRMHSTGGDAIFHASKGASFLQVVVEDSPADVDHDVSLDTDAADGAGFRFRPGSSGLRTEPRLAMVLGDTARAVFAWSGLEVAEVSEYGFRARPALRGSEYTNDSEAATRHDLLVYSADGTAERTALLRFGPFEVPAGAIHRTTIVDWPLAETLLSEIDLDADGEFDTSEVVSGSSCASVRDLIEAGMPRRLGEACGGVDGLFRRGDCDGNGVLNISDPICGLSFLFLGGEEPGCRDAADANDDGVLDLADSVFSLTALFLDREPLPAPGGETCGVDPTADAQSCAEYSACP